MSLDQIEWTIVLPAFFAGVLVLATHVPLGRRVMQRGIIFIDLAIAQIAAVGVIIAHLLGWDHASWARQLAAVTAALTGALLLSWTERRWPDVQEAIIGAIFVLAASAGILLLANDPHGGEHLHDMLVGQILWVSHAELLVASGITIGVLALLRYLLPHAGSLVFYLVFACAVTVSVQLVGVYLVFASLIIPALATRHYPVIWQLPIAYCLGILSYAMGLMLSAVLDVPAGAVIVWVLGVLGAAAYACYARWRAKRKQGLTAGQDL